MPPRLAPFQSLAQQCRSFVWQQTAKLSSSSPKAGLKHDASSGSALEALGTDNRQTKELIRMFNQPQVREARKQALSRTSADNNRRLRANEVTNSYLGQMPRRWNAGDVYAPHDLSPEEINRFRRRPKPKFDVLDTLGVNPLDDYRNLSMISEYTTPMGRIRHSSETCLRPANHRKMAKAIRRAIGLGIHPSVHHHPEILKRRYYVFGKQTTPTNVRF